jgi:coenzyme F420-reducing hydrogenase gamma subunit
MDVPVVRTGRARPINRDLECIGCLTCEATCPTAAIANNGGPGLRGPRNVRDRKGATGPSP